MRFIVKSDDPSLYTLLETARYQRLWKQYGRKIRKALRETTGLEFQQKVITARIHQTSLAESGAYRRAMTLSRNYGSENEQLFILIHELSHRLLAGNGLNLLGLGLHKEREETDQDVYAEKEDRHL